MSNILISIIGILITILLVVGVHEFGHFIVAKLCGVKVLRFSIGFGKTLLRCHDKSGTEYALSLLPLGGYVKMLDETDKPVSEVDKLRCYNHQPLYKKVTIIAAGPFFNLLFAFFIYWALFIVGFDTLAPITGKITPNSIAMVAGMKPNEEIISIDNEFTPKWINIVVDIIARAGDKNTLAILTKDINSQKTQVYGLNLQNWKMDALNPDPLDSLGIGVYEPLLPNIIGKIQADSPAEKADLQLGDRILMVNNKKVSDWQELVAEIADKPNQTLSFTLERAHKKVVLPVTIGEKSILGFHARGFLGLGPDFKIPENMLHHNQYNPLAAIGPALDDVKLFIKINLTVLGKMVSGKISLQSLGGPISIFESAGVALNNGIFSFLSFLAFLSISIGVINIIPIPGLDGGHLLLQTIEYVTGKPLSERIQGLCYRVGLAFLFVVLVQAVVNDILRL